MSDYSIRDLERDYYLGSYQTCISKANSMPVCRESFYYMCLSYCHMRKFGDLERELARSISDEDLGEDEDGNDFGTTIFDMIKAFAVDVTASDTDDDLVDECPKSVKIVEQLEATKALKAGDELSRILAAAIYARHKLYPKALQVIDRLDSLRVGYSRLIIYIMMNRGDLAENEVAKMHKMDASAPLTDLATAQAFLANRNPTQAWRIADNLRDRFRPSPLLNNLLTAAAICLGEYERAKEFCEESLDMDNDNLEALINMVHILSTLNASEQVLVRNLDRLKALYPKHEFVKQLESIPAELAAL